MIVISKKLFSLILVGLASLVVASLCAIFRLPMDQAVMLFLGTWVVLITLFEARSFFPSKHLQEPPIQK